MPDPRPTASSEHGNPLLRHAILLLFVAITVYALLPLAVSLLIAAWIAALGSPYLKRHSSSKTIKRRVAAAMTTTFLLVILLPLGFVVASLSVAVVDFVQRLRESEDWTAALRAATSVQGNDSTNTISSLKSLDIGHIVPLLREYGTSAATMLGTIAGATTTAAVQIIVFILAIYVFLAHGERFYDWLVKRSALSRPLCDRLADAFVETGRGLIIGVGLTALLQGVLAGIGYAILGIPRAAVLGFLTTVGAFIPSVGTGLVWVPVTISLILSQRTGAAIAMGAIGIAISATDNLIRPWLSRYGRLQLPTFAAFLAMLGGLLAFGPSGLLWGPLAMRLAVEGLEIWREGRQAS